MTDKHNKQPTVLTENLPFYIDFQDSRFLIYIFLVTVKSVLAGTVYSRLLVVGSKRKGIPDSSPALTTL